MTDNNVETQRRVARGEGAQLSTAQCEDSAAPTVQRPMIAGATVLVTGGAGFIGARLVAALRRRGARVRVLDDLSSQGRGSLDQTSATALQNNALASTPPTDFVLGSVLDEGAVARAMEGCSLVCHLAAVVGVARVVDDPKHTLRVNASGTRIVALEAARRGAALLYASSSEVYGPGGDRVMHEDDVPLRGAGRSSRWSYALSKLAGEVLVRDFAAAGQLRAAVVRFFNTTGAEQSPESGMVLPSMVHRALRGESIVVHGDGLQVRSFCDVSDTVRALELLLDGGHFDGRVFNVGSSEPVSILDLARAVALRTGAAIEHVTHEERFGAGFEDVRRRVPDTSRLAAAIGFEPRVGLDALVDSAVAYARQCAPVAALP